jgi:hypothetical protein
MKNKNLKWVAGALSLFLITASMHQQHTLPVDPQTVNTSLPFEKAQNGVQTSAKTYDDHQSKAYLHYNLITSGYTPVEITIKNHTGKSYALSAASVPLPLATSQDVAWSMTKKKIPGSIGLKILSFFFWPLMIPSTIEGITTYRSHKSLAKDLEAKTLKKKDEIIPPYTTVTRVLYVKKDGLQQEFSVALQEVDGKELLVVPTVIS